MSQIVIATSTIATECKPEHARKAVEILKAKGWDVVYGEKTANLPQDNPQWKKDYYAALEAVGH
jgi:hypothetical protein